MANFYGVERSNGFRVKNPNAFTDWARRCGLEPHSAGDPYGDRFILLPPQSDDECFPSYWCDPETGEEHDINLVTELSEHLRTGEFAVIMGCGHEKLRYVAGWAQVIAWDGRYKTINLNDIYKVAVNELGADPTRLTRADYEGIEPVETPSVGDTSDAIDGEAMMAVMAVRNTRQKPPEGDGESQAGT